MNNSAKNTHRIAAILAVAVFMAVTIIIPVYAEVLPGKPSVSPPSAVIYGKTYAEWAAAWHQWTDSIPYAKHPLFDTPPADPSCAEGQSGPVWFLGGRFCGSEQTECNSSVVVRSCTVPAGKSLFFPVVNAACLDVEAQNNYCFGAGPVITDMRSALASLIDLVTDLEVTVDHKRIKSDLKKDFRVQSPVYPTIVPADNYYQAIAEPEVVAGTYLGVDDGVYVMLDPLRKGKHTLRFKGTFPQYNFSLDVTYYLTIE